MPEFGELLRRLREKAGLSQKTLADNAGLDASHLNRVERGVRNPPKPRTVLLLAQTLMLGEEDAARLLSAAGHPAGSAQAKGAVPQPTLVASETPFSSGFSGSAPLQHPTVRLLQEIVADQQLPLAQRRHIAEQVRSFAQWLWHEAKECSTKRTRSARK